MFDLSMCDGMLDVRVVFPNTSSRDILLYVFRPCICLYDFHCLLIVDCTILDHLLENLITTKVVMKKFMVCMKLYGV